MLPFSKPQLTLAGVFLNHSSYAEGEVLLFRTKKSRHRAIPVMSANYQTSKFSDSITFKEWLKKVYAQDKGRWRAWCLTLLGD